MEFQVFSALVHPAQTAIIAVLILASFLYLPNLKFSAQIRKLPDFGIGTAEQRIDEYNKRAKFLYIQGCKKFKNSVFKMLNSDGVPEVVVGSGILPELRKLPDTVLSFPRAIYELMEISYTGLLIDDPLMIHSLKADLTPALARLNPVVYEEVLRSVKEEIPSCEDWTLVPVYPKLVSMVATITGRLFVGPELCRDGRYHRLAQEYTMLLIDAQLDIKKIRPLFRFWYAPHLPTLRAAEKEATEFLTPIIQARKDAQQNDPNWRNPDDMLGWMMARERDYGNLSARHLAQVQLTLSFAAIYTTTTSLTNILYSLAASPDYIGPLRDEIREVMAEHSGTITPRAMQQMLKLDSFMKEAMRFYPPAFTSFMRKVLQGFTLSNGQYIPAGANIEAASYAIAHDPDHFSDDVPAGIFDGFRFYNRRHTGLGSAHARNQFITTNETSLLFGYGSHACPGRFFATNEIKMILTKLLLDYDFKNEDGSTERYQQVDMGKMTAPDTSKKLLFKRVLV